jgi:hypothetical protein
VLAPVRFGPVPRVLVIALFSELDARWFDFFQIDLELINEP